MVNYNAHIEINRANPSLPDNFHGIYDKLVSSVDYKPTGKGEYKCRFCSNTGKDKFKTTAHLIPEFTGNKDLISFFECDLCNNKFAKYETDLSYFGGVRNVILPLKGENKKNQKHKDKKRGFELKNSFGKLNIKKHNSGNEVRVENNVLTIETERQSYVPRNVLKALTKIAMSLLSEDCISSFEQTITWLGNDKDEFTVEGHPAFILYGNTLKQPIRSPVAVLFKKKVEYNSPELCLIFMYGYHIYQYFVPFNKEDDSIDLKLVPPVRK